MPVLFVLGALISALACSSRMDFNFPILVFCFFFYTSTKVIDFESKHFLGLNFTGPAPETADIRDDGYFDPDRCRLVHFHLSRMAMEKS